MNAKNFTINAREPKNSPWLLPAFSVGGGCAAFALRLIQLRTGFEVSSGLPIPGNPAAFALLALLFALALSSAVLSRFLPKNAAPVFPFRTHARFPLALIVAGSFLLALSAGADLLEGASGINLFAMLQKRAAYHASLPLSLTGESVTGFRGTIQILSGLFMLIAAGGVLLCAAACRNGAGKSRGAALMLCPVAMVVRLVAIYRMDSINPVLEDYVAELLALSLLTLGFYHLSAFAFASGDLRRFTFYVCAAVPFCLCALADGGASGASPNAQAYLSAPALYLGGAATLIGFLLLALDAPSNPLPKAQTPRAA